MEISSYTFHVDGQRIVVTIDTLGRVQVEGTNKVTIVAPIVLQKGAPALFSSKAVAGEMLVINVGNPTDDCMSVSFGTRVTQMRAIGGVENPHPHVSIRSQPDGKALVLRAYTTGSAQEKDAGKYEGILPLDPISSLAT